MMKSSIASVVAGLLLFTGGLASAEPAAAQGLLVEAEHFADRGGWSLDTQFVDIMGSPYLLAHGLGKPVANARTEVNIPVSGLYTVWARTKNWVPGTWEAPGRFKLIIASKELDTVYGTEPGWGWQKGAAVQLEKGSVSLELKDLTGFDGRCDALFLTTDASYVPDNSSEPMNEWRRALLGVTMTAPEKEYDLVVVGGGLAGMGSAISAARMGLKVALIQDRPVLGGNGSSEIRVAPRGNYPDWLYPFGDLVNEYSPYIKENAGPAELYLDEHREKAVRAEKNIDLFLGHRAYKVTTADKRIETVFALSVKDKTVRQFRGRYFVDATGHGSIGLWAGAEYNMEEKDRMGMSCLWRWDYTPADVAFPAVPWALQLTEKGFPYPPKKGDWYWESGFSKHPLKDLEGIRDHDLRAVYGAWNAIKNKGAYAAMDKSGKRHGTAALEWVAYVGGTRETLQLLGDIVLAKKDILEKRQFEDACVIVTWGMDLHYPHPLYKKETPDDPFISRAHFGGERVDDSTGPLSVDKKVGVHSASKEKFDNKKGYAIPYRCLYSKNINNLFVPGRNMSVTHEVLGTVRVMQSLGMAGVAVGRAAYVAKQHDASPRDVYEKHLDEVKKVWALPAAYRADAK